MNWEKRFDISVISLILVSALACFIKGIACDEIYPLLGTMPSTLNIGTNWQLKDGCQNLKLTVADPMGERSPNLRTHTGPPKVN